MPDPSPLYGWPLANDSDSLKAAVKDNMRALVLAIESTLSGWAGVAAPLARINLSNANLSNSFTTTGSNTTYRKIGSAIDGHLQLGRASGWASDVTLWTMPVGYRPPHDVFFLASNVGSTYLCKIEGTSSASPGRVSCAQAGSGGLIGSFQFFL